LVTCEAVNTGSFLHFNRYQKEWRSWKMNKLGVTAKLVGKSGPRETLRRGTNVVKMIPVTPIMGKIVAKTMQVTKVRQVTWV
jgi:hypothetical protein